LLLDTGSQRTYLSGKVINNLQYPTNTNRKSVPYSVETFLHSGIMNFSEVSVLFDFFGKKKQLTALVNENFDMSIKVTFQNLSFRNVDRHFELVDRSLLVLGKEALVIDGILGLDLIPYLPPIRIEPCLNGCAMYIGSKVVPFGEVEGFLSRKHVLEMQHHIADKVTEQKAVVNFVLDPVPKYPDPIADVIFESKVEGNLEKLFR
jgi:hypothetical protein